MTKKRTLIILGFVIALIPFLGLPREFREVLIVVCGLSVATLAFLLKRKLAQEEKDEVAQNNISRNIQPPADKFKMPTV